MEEVYKVLYRIAIAIVALIILARLEGAKQISQLTFFDYIIGITVGSLAATMCIDTQIPWYLGLMGIVLFMLAGWLVSFITNKSIFMRRILTGVPIFLVAQGEVLYKGLKRARYDINDLLRELRTQGYFDITEINYAILEPSGMISVMPKSYARPPKVADMGLKIQEDSLKADVIIDGKILEGNLTAFGKNKEWLEEELKKQNVNKLKDIILGTLDEDGALNLYFKNHEPHRRTSLI